MDTVTSPHNNLQVVAEAISDWQSAESECRSAATCQQPRAAAARAAKYAGVNTPESCTLSPARGRGRARLQRHQPCQAAAAAVPPPPPPRHRLRWSSAGRVAVASRRRRRARGATRRTRVCAGCWSRRRSGVGVVLPWRMAPPARPPPRPTGTSASLGPSHSTSGTARSARTQPRPPTCGTRRRKRSRTRAGRASLIGCLMSSWWWGCRLESPWCTTATTRRRGQEAGRCGDTSRSSTSATPTPRSRPGARCGLRPSRSC
eukprot:COSAG01_NODE_5631_length_4130_cov_193.096750_6_plen_260_part_00